MTLTPGANPGSTSSGAVESPSRHRAYRRPGTALLIAAAGYVAAAGLLLAHQAVPTAFSAWPGWLQSLADLVILSAPLLVAIFIAGRVAADGVARGTGIHQWRWLDPMLGVLTSLVVRAVVELVAPTAGSLSGPFTMDAAAPAIAGTVVLVVGATFVSPVVEELFFRGLVLRALDDGLRGAGRIVAATTAVLVSTAAFVGLHVVAVGDAVPLGLIVSTIGVGLGCGILTVVTGRLGAAIIAHVTFNGIGVLLLLL